MNTVQKIFLAVFLLSNVSWARPPWREVLYETGVGGTKKGNRDEACDRAQERADNQLDDRCFSLRGHLYDVSFRECVCHHSGGKREYSCEVEGRGVCEY
jgi:hypothetical protein